MIHLGDITKISGYDAPIVDTVIFGAPCQDLSVAGKRAGMKHTDNGDDETTRSGLFHEAIRIIKEMRDKDAKTRRCSAQFIQPRFAVYENVPGALSSNKGEDFKAVIECLAKVIDKDAVIPMPPKGKWSNSGAIVGDGWSIAWRILDGQFWGCTYYDDAGMPIKLGTPQRRKRIALVADFGGECAPEILFERKGLRGDIEESGEPWQGASEDAEGCSLADDCKGEGFDGYNGDITGDKSLTLGVNCGISTGRNGVIEQVCYGIGSYDSNAMKSANPHSGIYEADTSKTLDLNGGNPCCNQGGIAVVESVPYTLKIRSGCEGGGKGALVQEDLSATLSTNNDQYLFQPLVVENHPADSRVNIDDSGKVQTLTSRMGTGGGNVPMVMEAVGADCYNQAVTGDKAMTLWNKAADSDHIPCVAIDRAYFNQGQNALYEPQLLADGTVSTLVAKGPSAVAYVDTSHADDVVRMDDVCAPLQARDYKGGGIVLQTKPHYIVRRLTPLECERLQGYPDYYTDIGDFFDSKGKKKTSSDAVRYKALGNSICLPPWKWVLKRICAHYERDATMASLFDGIGGFPFLWEQINGKGTAVWCSEIEDFPDAVTKVRIG